MKDALIKLRREDSAEGMRQRSSDAVAKDATVMLRKVECVKDNAKYVAAKDVCTNHAQNGGVCRRHGEKVKLYSSGESSKVSLSSFFDHGQNILVLLLCWTPCICELNNLKTTAFTKDMHPPVRSSPLHSEQYLVCKVLQTE